MKPATLRAFRLLRALGLWRLYRAMFSLSLSLVMLAPFHAHAYDSLFYGGFEAVTDAPSSDAEAARFLTMATFGPTPTDIAHLRAVGYKQWLLQQLSMPATLQRPTVEALDADDPTPGQADRLNAWIKNALTAPDQLRQRTAWALSQIMVATFQQSKLGNDPIALAELYDTLARDAFGAYPTLLYDVTRSPAMGKMLTYIRNKAGNPDLGTYPDENYAREVMQLFSIGLVLRGMDFRPIVDEHGDPIPTYEQATVSAYAQVFTGWSYTSGFNSNPVGPNWSPADYQPMICYDSHHDETHAKTLLSYSGNYGNDYDPFVLPANNGCENDLSQGLAIIANHPNVAPFISRQLIQRFTTSNPSPAYIERVANVFANDGAGVYGDLGAVIAAVLTDPEARYGNAATPPPAPLVFGKAREPLLKLTALYRYYNAHARDGSYSFLNYQAYLQVPLGAPSVFNFYLPDYLPPGELADAGLFGPEFQIMNESSVFTAANDLRDRTLAYVGNPDVDDHTLALDLSSLQTIANDPDALVAAMDHDLMYGGMSTHMHATLASMVAAMPADDPIDRVTSALQVVLASPEFAIQK